MAAPALTPRLAPTGVKLDDGFATLYAFSINNTVELWEKVVKPPGIDGGDKVMTSTMHNVAWQTSSPRKLKTLTDGSMNCAYDPKVYTDILALINVSGAITAHFPDGSAVTFYGFLKSFEPGELKEGEQPEAACVICPTNYDPVNHVEEAPKYHVPGGT